MLFSGKIYTADKNFTGPPVATVATNSKSGPRGLKKNCRIGTALHPLLIAFVFKKFKLLAPSGLFSNEDGFHDNISLVGVFLLRRVCASKPNYNVSDTAVINLPVQLFI